MTVVDANPDPPERLCRPDTKPPARIVDKNAGREKVRREGCCRCTQRTDNITRFHLVGRDLGGDDIDDNIVPIWQGLHEAWEHAPHGKKQYGPWIWSRLQPWERDYVLEKKGVDFVRRYYGVDLLD